MKQKIIFLLWLSLPFFCLAQNNLAREYDYDEAGNRVVRKILIMHYAPPVPPDSITNYKVKITNDDSQTADLIPQIADFFVEKIAQMEIKIYPNPATEKIILEIANMEKLQVGNFKLFSLTGQLLQERPVHSVATEVSLAGLAKGAYILKVHINDRTEEWKIIKN
ncbi:MAG: T9SS type A sorting domain-containing protein [Bacteroidetes bacterium]|nr:T9SS type A sorting domain-containing protein [Bacteroidota bacterium]MCL1968349.1 T9SS type A sorting domain-containing protein [Bacteroidota bacterium]